MSTSQSVELTLLSMGYRRMKTPEKSPLSMWGKPVCTSLYVVCVQPDQLEFRCHFRDAQGKISIWASSKVQLSESEERWASRIRCTVHQEWNCGCEEDRQLVPGTALLNWLKHSEGYHARAMPELPSEFQFVTESDVLLVEAAGAEPLGQVGTASDGGRCTRRPRGELLGPGHLLDEASMMNEEYVKHEERLYTDALARAEKGSRVELREATEAFKLALESTPELIAERVSWLLCGNYGYGACRAAHLQMKATPDPQDWRLTLALIRTIAALEWLCPIRRAETCWRGLTDTQKNRLIALVAAKVQTELTEPSISLD